MNKSLFIIVLAAIQSACSSQGPAPDSAGPLLDFAAINAEISIRHEPAEPAVDPLQTLSMRHE